MDWLRLAIEELEKRNSISAGMARDQHKELLARIQELETAGRDGLTREYFEGFKAANQRLELILATAKETGLIDAKSVRKIMLMDAALLNNTPLEKE